MVTKKREMKVVVHPFTVTIIFDSAQLAIRDRDNQGDPTYGEMVVELQAIYIRHDMMPELEKETVVHELKHFVNYIAGINDESLKNMDEEHIVRVTAPIWFGLLRDNPELLEYLTS